MQEVQRFNKVLKSFVLSGDIILLNLLLWVFGSLWGNRSPFEFSMPLFQNMALMTLCYLVCNIRSGVILHRPVEFRSDPSSSGGSPGTNNASGGPEYDSFCIDSTGAFVHISF